MRVVIMDRLSYSIISIKNVTSITYNNGTVTVVGVNEADNVSATFTAQSSRSIVRIMEN